MRKTDLAWAAGFFDGEGCVSASVRGSKQYMNLCTHVSNTNKPAILHFHTIAGCGTVRRHVGATHYSLRRRMIWEWYGYLGPVKPFLTELLPYLLIKKQEVKLFLKLADGRRWSGNGRRAYTTQQKQQRLGIVQKIKRLKKREWK